MPWWFWIYLSIYHLSIQTHTHTYTNIICLREGRRESEKGMEVKKDEVKNLGHVELCNINTTTLPAWDIQIPPVLTNKHYTFSSIYCLFFLFIHFLPLSLYSHNLYGSGMFPFVDFTLIECNDSICSRKCPCWTPSGAEVVHMYMHTPVHLQKKKKKVWLTSEYQEKLKLLVEVRVTGRGLTPQACLQEIPVKVRETDIQVIISCVLKAGLLSQVLMEHWWTFHNRSAFLQQFNRQEVKIE